MTTDSATEVGADGRTGKILGAIERVGNKLPHPFFLFLYIAVFIVIVSAIAAGLGAQTISPTTGDPVAVKSLLSGEGIQYMLTSAIENFVTFPPLGLILTVMMGIGLAERVGLLDTFMRGAVLAAPKSLITAVVVVVSLMGNIASDSAMVILPPLAAAAFLAAGRHPLAGFAASYSAVVAGFSANIIIAGTDVLLSGITTQAARIVDPEASVSPLANWFFMSVSTVVLAVVIIIVCQKFVEPRLGTYRGEKVVADVTEVSPQQRKALRWAGIAALVYLILLAAAVLPGSSPLRGEGGAILKSPFLSGLPIFILLFFLAVGITYGKLAGTITTMSDIPAKMTASIKELAPFLVVIFTAAQAIAYFNWTQLGLLVASGGADAMKATGLDGMGGLLLFSLFVTVPALLIASGSALWTLLAPIFVPMFMLNGIDPAYVQAAFRITDSATNTLVPMNPMLPVILGMIQLYNKKAGLGTLFSLVIPFTVAIWAVWLVLYLIWGLIGLPIGPGHGLNLP